MEDDELSFSSDRSDYIEPIKPKQNIIKKTSYDPFTIQYNTSNIQESLPTTPTKIISEQDMDTLNDDLINMIESISSRLNIKVDLDKISNDISQS